MAKNIKKTTPKEYQTIKLRELITELETLSIACFGTDEERNITSTGIYSYTSFWHISFYDSLPK
jgi:hypothetical protein